MPTPPNKGEDTAAPVTDGAVTGSREGAGPKRRGPLAHNPDLDHLRIPPSDKCWWCGSKADTQEHRFKHSSLRRVAAGKGPTNVFKVSDDYSGTLKSISKGVQVKWPKNLCANCNGSRSQPFDYAYDEFEAFLFQNGSWVGGRSSLDWAEVFGEEWEAGATNLARYFGKQLGCMLAAQNLPVPSELVKFLDGSPRCPSVGFSMARNWRGVSADRVMRRHNGGGEGLMTFIGLLPAPAYTTEGRFSGIDYGYHIGYVWMVATWRAESQQSAWFEQRELYLPLFNGSVREKLRWSPRLAGMEYRHAREKMASLTRFFPAKFRR